MERAEQNKIFKEWIEQFKPLVFKIVRVYGSEFNGDDDLFQEIVVQIWKSIPNFKKQCSVHTWIYKISLNTAIKWSTRRKKSKHENLDDHFVVLDKHAITNPKLDWLYNEISLMDTLDRSLTLLLLDGFSYKEMSEIIGITASNVGVKINRIKNKLKESAKIIEHEN